MPKAAPTPSTLGKAPVGGAGFNSFAAGDKAYGMGRPMPNVGSTTNMAGYGKRDAQNANRRDALMRRAGLGG